MLVMLIRSIKDGRRSVNRCVLAVSVRVSTTIMVTTTIDSETNAFKSDVQMHGSSFCIRTDIHAKHGQVHLRRHDDRVFVPSVVVVVVVVAVVVVRHGSHKVVSPIMREPRRYNAKIHA